MPAKPLTEEQKADAARLNAIYKARRENVEPGLTQAVLADDLGFSTQSAVSQYLQGKVPLNVEAAVKFAERLECSVSDFSATMQQVIDRIAGFSSANRKSRKGNAGISLAAGQRTPSNSESEPSGTGNHDNHLSVVDRYLGAPEERRVVADYFLRAQEKPVPAWVDGDARAYADSLEMKVHRWIVGKSEGKTKTGT